MADRAKIQYSKFISTVVKEHRSEFANFDKVKQRLGTFLFAFVLAPTYLSDLRIVFKILLILSHGQAQVERGFSVNSKLLVENQYADSLAAQHIVHDHVVYHELQPHSICFTTKMLANVKEARSRYFADQKESSVLEVRTDRDTKVQNINENINTVNKEIAQLNEAVSNLIRSSDEYVLEGEHKTDPNELKSLLLLREL